LFELEGLSTEEIATLYDVRLSTARVWLHRGRARFAKLYERWRAAGTAGAGGDA